MAKKMYYSEAEAAGKLGINPEQLTEYVEQQKLRAYQDGPNRMFRVDEVDKLASGVASEPSEQAPSQEAPPSAESSADEIELTPADTETGDEISLEEADTAPSESAGKDDTVVTTEGISIFDDEDLEIEAADPMAKTQIAPSLEDQVALEGVGSGSGLLDLTRESDDTSLGAEVLDNIDVDSAEIAQEISDRTGETPSPAQPAAPAAPITMQAPDPTAGLFTGFVAGLVAVVLLLGGAALAVMQNALPGYLESIQNNLPIVVGLCALLVGIGGLVGYFVGKSAASPQPVSQG